MKTQESEYTFMQRNAWIVHILVFTLLLLSAMFILFSGVDPNDFGASTGTSWEAFQAAEPAVGGYIERLEALLGASGVGLALFGAAVALTGFRRGQRSAWLSMWAAPICYGLVTAVMLAYASPIGYFYLFVALIQTAIQVVSVGRFRGQPA